MHIPGKLNRQQKERYNRLFGWLRKRCTHADDVALQEIHEEVFASTDCLSCANCCKTHPPLVNGHDIRRISAHLGIRSADFVSKYLILDEDGDWVLNTVPCQFLAPDNSCTIYAYRPAACREYPHTDRKRLYQISELTLKNAEICPAVSVILDNMYKKAGI